MFDVSRFEKRREKFQKFETHSIKMWETMNLATTSSICSEEDSNRMAKNKSLINSANILTLFETAEERKNDKMVPTYGHMQFS